MTRQKMRRLGPGSWFVPGLNTLHLAHAMDLSVRSAPYLDGYVIW